jgi:uncharacterized repeat protein (TIGR02543 family)
MKKFLLSIFALCAVILSANAAKIYVNAGHGSWNTANCRNMRTINYQSYGDTLGFWESNTNMWKCYSLQEKLVQAGHTVKMSRTQSGGTSMQNNSTCDKKLSVIAMESENWGSDYFISVHSNAAATDDYGNALVNYPSYFFRGTMSRSNYNPYVKNSDKMAIAAWPYMFIVHDNKMEYNSYWSMTNPGIYGDITQMGSQSTVNGYTGYFGVLKHGDPGYLVEGYFHVYSPARHRAMNPDWCRQEGIRHYRGIQAWYGNPNKDTKGYIMGYIRTKEKKLTHNFYKPKPGTNDEYHPINGAKVVLRNSKGEVIKTDCYRHVARRLKNQDYYTTDHQYNGVFVYENLVPGEYTMYVYASGYKNYEEKITVKADETSYTEIFLTSGQGTDPVVGDIDPDIEWELNGGIIPGGTVPTNEQLWETYKAAWTAYYNVTRADQPITAVSTFMTKGCEFMTDSKSSFKWLGDYIKEVSAAQGYTLSDDPAADGMEALWRWSVHSFFNCEQRTSWPQTADFSAAGKPAAWGEKYLIGTGSSATLPSSVSSTYTLPTPVKEGYVFLGWYDNPNGTGNKITSIPAGWKGKLYALWEEEAPADVKWQLNGGTVSVTLPKEITGSPYTIPTPTKTGYVFLGWYDNANGTGTALTSLPVGWKGTVYAIWREAKVTWVLNGGKVLKEVTGADAVKVPTQEELWTSFKTAADITALGTLAEIIAEGGSNPHNDAATPCACRVICTKLNNTKMEAIYKNAEWKWLFDYILGVQPDIETDLTVDGATAAWRYAVAAFFLQSKHDAYPVTEDFTNAGKPEMWGPAYKEAHSNSGATSTQEVTLPSKITATYTIPTPVKDGADFLGWYDTNDVTGTKLTTLPAGYDGTVYAIWSDAKEPDVEWVLNGGKVVKEVTTTTPGTEVKVPTQEELWANFKTTAGLTTLGTLEEIKAKGEGQPHTSGDTPCGCRIICGKLTAAEVQTVFGKAEWKWLQTYIMSVQSDLTDDLTAAAWRYAIAAFFLQSQHSAWPASADFTEAGKPEKWGPAYQKANGATEGTTTTTLVEVELPKWITGSAYTIPTPVKDGDTFIGWYENNKATGTALTVLPVGYKGTVYAIWKSNVSTGVEDVRPELDLNMPMYDIIGRQVDATYRGIVIQNGNKYLLR